MAKNVYKVPVKQWKKWSKQAQGVFNRSYHFFIGNQGLMTHPKTERVLRWRWKTTAWNAAWIAASAVDDVVPTKVVDV